MLLVLVRESLLVHSVFTSINSDSRIQRSNDLRRYFQYTFAHRWISNIHFGFPSAAVAFAVTRMFEVSDEDACNFLHMHIVYVHRACMINEFKPLPL